MLENESKSRFENETEKSFENKSESRLKGERYAEDMFSWKNGKGNESKKRNENEWKNNRKRIERKKRKLQNNQTRRKIREILYKIRKEIKRRRKRMYTVIWKLLVLSKKEKENINWVKKKNEKGEKTRKKRLFYNMKYFTPLNELF